MGIARNLNRFFYKALRQPVYAASVLSKRLAARAHYIFAGGKSSDPESITLFLTHRCNLRCKMCGQWGDGGVTRKAAEAAAGSIEGAGLIKNELPFENIVSLVDEVARYKPNITLFGGEPLLHTRAVDIIRHVKSKGLHCLIITNGSLLSPMAEAVASSGLDELNVSLDGPADLHDRIRALPGLYGKIMSGLRKMAAIKLSKNSSKPLVNIQCTITKYNISRLEEMPRVAEEAGADSLTFHNLIFTDARLLEEQRRCDAMLGCSSGDWEGFNFEPGLDPEELYDRMSRILSREHKFSMDFYPNFSRAELIKYYRDPCFSPGLRCLSPWIAAYVFPDGEVRPCLNCTYSYGNIKSSSFGSSWNGDKAIAFRRALKKAGAFPLCRRCTELYRY